MWPGQINICWNSCHIKTSQKIEIKKLHQQDIGRMVATSTEEKHKSTYNLKQYILNFLIVFLVDGRNKKI